MVIQSDQPPERKDYVRWLMFCLLSVNKKRGRGACPLLLIYRDNVLKCRVKMRRTG